MKLFQRLLVTPAVLSLMAPVAANADAAFSSTTTLGGSAFLLLVLLLTVERQIRKKNYICNTSMYLA